MHELEIIDGKAQMAYAGEVPWHGLGKRVPADLSTDQFMKVAGLDWVVEKEDMLTASGNAVSGKKALVRSTDKKVLDIVGKDWVPVQNKEAFDFFEEYVRAGNMQMHTAGSLKDGQVVWALAKTNDSFELFNGDVTEQFFLFSNSHRFGRAIDIRSTSIRVVCNNTLQLSLAGNSRTAISVNHRQAFNPDLVKEQLGMSRQNLTEYKNMAKYLGSKQFNDENLTKYFAEVFAKEVEQNDDGVWVTNSRNAKRAMEIIDVQPGNNFAKGSWWQAFNAVTYFVDHMQGRNADSRLYSSWYGSNRRLKNTALRKALDYAGC